MQKPTIGRIVIYNTTSEDRENMRHLPACNVQEKLPAIIVAVWGDMPNSAVNLQVICDGSATIWKTSICVADTPGQEGRWEWPVKE
jgi:hypothetical protein